MKSHKYHAEQFLLPLTVRVDRDDRRIVVDLPSLADAQDEKLSLQQKHGPALQALSISKRTPKRGKPTWTVSYTVRTIYEGPIWDQRGFGYHPHGHVKTYRFRK